MQLIFPVPNTSYEIMVFADDMKTVGIAYDPLSTRPPRSWTSECERCQLDDRSIPLKVRRAIRSLSTIVLVARGGYSIKVHTGKKHSHTIWVKAGLKDWHLSIRCRKQKLLSPMKITGCKGTITSQAGSMRKWRGPVLVRTIRMLLGARVGSENEVRAVMLSLPNDVWTSQRKHTHHAEIIQRAGLQLPPNHAYPVHAHH